MTAAEDRRDELEAVIRRQLTNIVRRPHTGNECTDAILRAADAYARACRPPGADRPAAPKKAPVVHYSASAGSLTACRPGDFSSKGWRASAAREVVTCESCIKALARQGGEPG